MLGLPSKESPLPPPALAHSEAPMYHRGACEGDKKTQRFLIKCGFTSESNLECFKKQKRSSSLLPWWGNHSFNLSLELAGHWGCFLWLPARRRWMRADVVPTSHPSSRLIVQQLIWRSQIVVELLPLFCNCFVFSGALGQWYKELRLVLVNRCNSFQSHSSSSDSVMKSQTQVTRL